MKKILFIAVMCFAFVSCNSEKNELYEHTDYFVESLNTTYESYGLLGGAEHTRYTDNGYYKIMPVGRLINVRIEKAVDDKEYEKLKKDLEGHYKNDKRVNQVYICGGGTIMIDCRN
jgi:hypothetical protein